MSLLKTIIGAVFPSKQGTEPASGNETLLNSVVGMIGAGGLNSLLDKLRQNGLGEAVESWIGTGENAPVSGEQVQDSLGEQKVAEIAQRAGLSKEETAGGLAQLLPQVVDKLSPDGKLPDAASLGAMLQSFMGALGTGKSEAWTNRATTK